MSHHWFARTGLWPAFYLFKSITWNNEMKNKIYNNNYDNIKSTKNMYNIKWLHLELKTGPDNCKPTVFQLVRSATVISPRTCASLESF